MGTKNDPGEFDCYRNAEPDEPMFILLARDKYAPILVKMWALLKEADGDANHEKSFNAYSIAQQMEAWRKANRP